MKSPVNFLSLLFLSVLCLHLNGQSQKETFDFEFEGFVLNGVLNLPESEPKGLVLIVHGSGRTNAVAQDWHSDVRRQLVKSGYSVYMWDKMGCGNSEGTFDYNQTVQNSADEVIAAIKTLRKKRIPGAKKIGLWGISRGGWINPLVIKKYKKIEFWISVSGVDEKENFKYLLAENLRINGYPKDSIDLLVGEWQAGTLIAHRGGSFEEYEAATRNLWQNKFLLRFNNGVRPSKANYDAGLAAFMEQSLDEATGLPVYIPNFERVLSKVKCPVYPSLQRAPILGI